MSNTILELCDLTIGYSAPRRPLRVIVESMNAVLETGELVCLIGPNGAGKTTLMRTIARMQPPLSGSVKLLRTNVQALSPQELAHQLSIVLTERVDVGILSAYALVALGRFPYTDWTGKLSVHDEDVVRWAMEAVGATELAQRHVSELSDGERQKVMIARALAQEPVLMLLDEPTAFLDLPRRVEIMQVLRRIAHDNERAILLSTHDLDLALRSADRIWLLPQGGPLQVGAPEDLVLSGAFEAAFRSEGVQFDQQTGSFRLHAPFDGRIRLIGDGLYAVWTQRALERAGWEVVKSGSDGPQIEIIANPSSVQWRLTSPTGIEDYKSIHTLVAALKTIVRAQSTNQTIF